MYCQSQDDQLQQGSLLVGRTGTTRPEIRPDGGGMKLLAARGTMRLARMALNSKVMLPLDLM